VVEQGTHKPLVGGPNPPVATIFYFAIYGGCLYFFAVLRMRRAKLTKNLTHTMSFDITRL